MPVVYGSPAYYAKLEKQKQDRAELRRGAFLKRAVIKSAIRKAALKAREAERKKWSPQVEAAVRRGNKHYRDLRDHLPKEKASRKQWEAAAEAHLRELKEAKARIAELERETARLTKKIDRYKKQEDYQKLFWTWVKKRASTDTWKWLCVLWKRGPKPSPDKGWGGGQ